MLNNVSPKIYLLLIEAIEEHLSLPVIGFMPEVKESVLKSRQLGLVQSNDPL